MSRLKDDSVDLDSKRLSKMTAIIDSMTRGERQRPAIINGKRRRRIACGSGTSVEEVNRLLKQFSQIRKMLKTAQGLKNRGRRGPKGGKGHVVSPRIRHVARQMLQ